MKMIETVGGNYEYIAINPVHVVAIYRTKGKTGCMLVMSDGYNTILQEDPRRLSGRVSAELAGLEERVSEDEDEVAKEWQNDRDRAMLDYLVEELDTGDGFGN